MKTLIVDFSPIVYRFAFSSTTYASAKLKLKKNEIGVYNFNEYKDIFIFKLLDYISQFKTRFNVDEVVLALDSSPYWRKAFWSGYKHGRLKNDKSGIDWLELKKCAKEITNLLKENSTYKVIDLLGAEGDDTGFVLSKELSARGHQVIVKSLDHDWYYNLEYNNVKYWQTKHNHKTKQCGFVEFHQDELDVLKWEHCFFGDKGDYLLGVNAYTQFSPEFKSLYPKMTELKAWPKRHEIDQAFIAKHKVQYPELFEKNKLSAYKQPPFGAKSYNKKKLKEGFTDQEFLDLNPIHQLNYDLNTMLALPAGIPDDVRQLIITEYDNTGKVLDTGALTKYFMDNNIFDLIGKLGMF